MPSSTYKIRFLKKPDSKNDYDAASIAVPMDIARVLPDDMKFMPELTEDGILYKPVAGPTSTTIPSWAIHDEGVQSGAKASRDKTPAGAKS